MVRTTQPAYFFFLRMSCLALHFSVLEVRPCMCLCRLCMERTSSLELFRGSDAFSSLAFLDGQDASREANSCHTIVEGLQPSQAIPASMPVASLHLTDPTQGPSKLLHSRLASGFSAWPQTASTPYTSIAMHHPASARHSFLPFGTPASQHAAGTADCQADSFAALLADDTALGFADDCFRRESDLYLSQDRAMPSDAAHREGLQSNADEDGFAIEQPQHPVMASGQPAVAPASTQPAATASAPHQHPTGDTAPVIASPQTAPLHSPAMATLSQEAAAAQPPTTTSSQHPPPPVTEDTCPSAACAGMTADPQAAHGQQQPAGSGAQTRPDALGPTQASPQTSITNKQEHMMPAAASSSPVAGLKGKDSDVNSIGASSSIRNQAVLRLPQQSVPAAPQTQAVLSPQRARAPMHTPAVSAQPAEQSTHPDAAGTQAAAPPEIRAQSNAAADATAADAAAAAAAAAAGSDSQLPQGAGRLQQGAQVCAPHSQQQVLGSDHSAVAGPKLAVQDYQLPLPPTAQDTPATIPWAQQAPAQPLVRQGTHHTRLAEDASASLDMGGPSGESYLACIVAFTYALGEQIHSCRMLTEVVQCGCRCHNSGVIGCVQIVAVEKAFHGLRCS